MEHARRCRVQLYSSNIEREAELEPTVSTISDLDVVLVYWYSTVLYAHDGLIVVLYLQNNTPGHHDASHEPTLTFEAAATAGLEMHDHRQRIQCWSGQRRRGRAACSQK